MKRMEERCIRSHLLSKIPYKTVAREKVALPKRQKPHGYRESRHPLKFVKEKY